MLSILFDLKHEWWVSGTTFDRLFQAALDSGKMSSHVEHWRHVADANGGLDLSTMEPSETDELVTALRDTAERELARLKNVDPASADGSYRIGLLKRLEVI